ncbi:MAG: PH domain-containing protein, partial [Candidatus Nanohaloarchaea archaeon]|nr:PH domain-containing protein [Candidatus Nanohaloarchaea archaeon]
MELPQRLHPTPLKAEYLIGYSIGAAAMLIGGGLLLALYLGLLPSGLVPALPSPIAGIVALLPYLLLGLLVLYGAYKLLYTELRLRRWHTYTFYDDHVVVEKGYYYWFEHKSDDIPYHQITNVFVEEDWSGFVYLGNLKVIMEGSSEPVVIEGLRNPHPFERLMMGADPAEIT